MASVLPNPHTMLAVEDSSAFYECILLDQEGDAVPLSAVTGLTVKIYDQATGDVLRAEASILNVNGGTFHATSGRLTLTFSPDDNAVVGDIGTGQREEHRALFHVTWDSNDNGFWWFVRVMVHALDQVPT